MDNKFSVSLSQIQKFDINLSKDINNINDYNMPLYKPLNFSKLSYFYPTLEIFNNETDFLDNDNVSLFTNRQIVNYNTVYNNITNSLDKVDIFFKFAPLLDPTRYMIGKYSSFSNNINVLPKLNDNSVLEKYRSVHNASYTDNFACFLLGKLLNHHNFLHGIEYFGSFLSIQEKYRIDIVDELEYLYESDFFKDNLNKLFVIDEENKANGISQFLNYGSRGNKPKLTINDDINIDNIDNIDNDLTVQDITDTDFNEIIYEKTNPPVDKEISHNSDDDSDDSEIEEDDSEKDNDEDQEEYEYNSDEEEEEEDEDEENEEEETPVFAFINNFPVQTICIEKCHGTFDELLVEDNIDVDTGRSILFQIIMILITLQKCFHLTHNDLHTNNVMFVNTDIKHLYYRFNKKCYKVPTYGKIIKIIDYGRSIFKYDGNLFCSDSYSPSGDAHTQYNTEPFFNKDKPRLEPNYSFDLCRLGCSIYDFIIDDDMDYKELDDFQKIISDWCSDDSNRNILYKKNGEERYPDFKLYKMIARTVHKHTPEEQLNRSYFSKYESKDFKDGFDIDAMPTYF